MNDVQDGSSAVQDTEMERSKDGYPIATTVSDLIAALSQEDGNAKVFCSEVRKVMVIRQESGGVYICNSP